VQPSGSGQADVKARVEQVARFLQHALRFLRRLELQEAFRADPGPALKQALKMKFRQAHAGRDLAQLGLAPGIAVQVADGLLDQLVIVGGH